MNMHNAGWAVAAVLAVGLGATLTQLSPAEPKAQAPVTHVVTRTVTNTVEVPVEVPVEVVKTVTVEVPVEVPVPVEVEVIREVPVPVPTVDQAALDQQYGQGYTDGRIEGEDWIGSVWEYATVTPCATEDAENCYWDAATMGNGIGDSFVNIEGAVHYR